MRARCGGLGGEEVPDGCIGHAEAATPQQVERVSEKTPATNGLPRTQEAYHVVRSNS